MDPIGKIPKFDHDLDELILSKCTLAEQMILRSQSELKQLLRWAAETARIGYNCAIDHGRKIKDLERDRDALQRDTAEALRLAQAHDKKFKAYEKMELALWKKPVMWILGIGVFIAGQVAIELIKLGVSKLHP